LLSHSGNVFVLSAPSGTGKSTIAKQLVHKIANLDFSISFTTRLPRPGEVDGQDYFFVDHATFDRMVADNGFIEWVEVYGNRYGTGRAWIEAQFASGQDILLDIESRGAQNVHRAIPDAVMVFLLPPSAQELARRLRGRGDSSEEQLKLRLDYAKHELAQFPAYEYLVINDTVELAYRGMEAIVLATRLKRGRMNALANEILEGF